MFKIKLNIQSCSDIITNSSSELFCTISSNNLTIQMLYNILGSQCVIYDTDDEFTFSIYLDYDCFQNTVPEDWLKSGIISKLNEKLGKENYEIIFD